MKRIVIVLGIIALATLLFAQQGRFNGPRSGEGKDMEKPFPQMRGLDLTEEQQTQIDKMHLEMQKEVLPLRSELESLNDAYRLLVIDDKSGEAAISKNLEKQNELRTKMRLKRADHIRKIRALLTDEQKTQFDNHFLAKENRRGRGNCREGDRGPRQERRFRDSNGN